MVLHQQLLDVSEAVCQRRLRRQVQNEEVSPRLDQLVCIDHRCVIDALVEGVLGSPFGPLLVLLDEGDIASVLELEELGVLAVVEDIALLGPVELIFQHPVVAVGNGLPQVLVLLWVVADRRLPELLDDAFVVHLTMFGCFTALIECRCLSCFRK